MIMSGIVPLNSLDMPVEHDGEELVEGEELLEGFGLNQFPRPPTRQPVPKGPVGVVNLDDVARVFDPRLLGTHRPLPPQVPAPPAQGQRSSLGFNHSHSKLERT